MSELASQRLQRIAGIDLRSLAAFRIGLGALIFWDQLHALFNVRLFYSDDGVLPRTLLRQAFPQGSQWSLHLLGGSVLFESLLILAAMLAACSVVLGWRTRWSLLIAWLLTISLHTRNPAVLYGADTVLRMMAFWCLFLPVNARWSIDAKHALHSEPNPHTSMASLAILLQVAMIYWFTAALKNGNEWTRDGSAVYYVLMADQFVRAPGVWLLQHDALCRALTFGVWWLEMLGPFLAFIPWRTALLRNIVIIAMATLHLGLALCLRIGYFPYAMLLLWVLFVPACVWDALSQRWSIFNSPAMQNAPRALRFATQNVIALLLALVLVWNLWTLNPTRWANFLHTPVRSIAEVLRLDQNWALFAPSPITDDGWMILDAELHDGTHIDLLRNGKAVNFDKPRDLHSEYPDWKWHKLEVNLATTGFTSLRQPFGDALARTWCRQHPTSPKVRRWTLWFVREETLPHHLAFTPQRIELAKSNSFSLP